MDIKNIITPAHKNVARALGHALVGGDVNAWEKFMCGLAVNLTPSERRALAFSAIRVLEPDDIGPTLEAVLPSPPFTELMQAAECWALFASQREREAYCYAAFNRMASARQAAFLEFVQGRAAA
jgi:hypothetical protein